MAHSPQQTARSQSGVQPLRLAVVGAATCDERLGRLAWDVGHEIGKRQAILLCGGGSGVMEHSAAGARAAGGSTVGILPGTGPGSSPPNTSIDLPVFTGLGQARNVVLVLSAHAVIAIGGGWGTLSEIGLAMKHGIPCVELESWRLEHPTRRLGEALLTANSPAEAVELATAAARRIQRKEVSDE